LPAALMMKKIRPALTAIQPLSSSGRLARFAQTALEGT
jgi:hypothetical protein